MNLRSRLLILGCIFLISQILVLSCFFYYYLNPKIANLEKGLVERNLHRGLELLQRELFHLEHLTKLLANQSMIQKQVSSLYPSIQTDIIEENMLRHDLNLIYILDTDHKVIWGTILDLQAEKPYPPQPFLTSLWDTDPSYLGHTSLLSLQAGIFNSSLGPMLVVSAPIPQGLTTNVQGTLIVGRLITQDVIHLLQSLTYTDVKLWPLGGSSLNPKQRSIIQQLIAGDSDFMAEKTGNLFRGYMVLQDLNGKPSLLLSATQERAVSLVVKLGFFDLGVIYTLLNILFLILIYFLIKSILLTPARKLIQELEMPQHDLRLLPLEFKPWNEIGFLANAVSNTITKYQDRLAQATNQIYREGIYQIKQNLYRELEDVLKPIIAEIEVAEKKLSNLPTTEIEWIIAECKTGKISVEHLAYYTKKLQFINEKLRQYQRESRNLLYNLYLKTRRNAADLRAQARSLETIRDFTPIVSEYENNLPLSRSRKT